MERKRDWRYLSALFLLSLSALALTARVVYLYLADGQRFPINTVKITAPYQHVSRQELETILSSAMVNNSFFTLPVSQLRSNLKALPWTKDIQVERIWPDILKLNLVENNPVAEWNDGLLMENGAVFYPKKQDGESQFDLPKLQGPRNQQEEVLQVYQKMSKILMNYGFYAASFEKRDNQAWELKLTNGIQLRLGKKEIEAKLIRFCKAYPAVFSDKSEHLVSVDLRYPRGMAVQWTNETGR